MASTSTNKSGSAKAATTKVVLMGRASGGNRPVGHYELFQILGTNYVSGGFGLSFRESQG